MIKKINKKAAKSVLVINRKNWLRGEGSDRSYLLRKKDRKMCCIGFDCLRRGFTKQEICGMPGPVDMLNAEPFDERLIGLLAKNSGPRWATSSTRRSCSYFPPTKVAEKLMIANDDEELTESEREKRIIQLYSKINVKVKFV